MNKVLVGSALCLLLALPVAAQKKANPETDGYNWETDGLKGKVKSVRLELPPSPEYDGPNEPMVRVTLYDSAGRRVKETTTSPSGSLNDEEVYSYSTTGKIIERKGYRKNDRTDLHITWEYNDKDQLISSTIIKPDRSVDLKTTYEYDGSGKKTLKTLIDPKSPDFKYVSKYDERERLVEEIETRDNVITHHRRVEYDYYPNGKLHKVASREQKREPVMGQAEIYDENGNLTEFIRYGANNELDLRVVFKTDEQGSVAETAFYGANGERRGTIKTSYEYDRQGNWIKKTDESMVGGQLSKVVTTRSITYFDQNEAAGSAANEELVLTTEPWFDQQPAGFNLSWARISRNHRRYRLALPSDFNVSKPRPFQFRSLDLYFAIVIDRKAAGPSKFRLLAMYAADTKRGDYQPFWVTCNGDLSRTKLYNSNAGVVAVEWPEGGGQKVFILQQNSGKKTFACINIGSPALRIP
jgi:hypothetical protein